MKKFLLSLIIFLFPLCLEARNAKDAFLSMPSHMFLEISVDNRMDLIDMYEADAKATVQNRFQEDIYIENLTEDYLLLNSGKSTIQIIVLPMVNESQLYSIIHTVCGPICDSQIEFYSLSWKKLDTETFINPALSDWFVKTPENFPEIKISFMQLVYNPKNKVLEQTDNSFEYLSKEDQEKIKPYMKEKTKKYKWNGVRFL